MATGRREISEAELEGVVRWLVRRASGLAGSEFRGELGTEQRAFAKQAVEVATDLAARREIRRWSSAKKVRFFAGDPFDNLGRAVAEVLEASAILGTEQWTWTTAIHDHEIREAPRIRSATRSIPARNESCLCLPSLRAAGSRMRSPSWRRYRRECS
ncbi:MAG: hypothetical protein JW751_28175 [Polyangiaceae bacterium]|nr:hypothetical protein [Polyangiaceae bacterium]